MQELSIEHKEWTLSDGSVAKLRTGNPADLGAIRDLYFKTYGNQYTISEIANPDHTARALANKTNYLWIVTEVDNNIVGSVIFTVDPYHRLGKAFSGVIKPEYRGQKMIYTMMKEGHNCLLREGGPCDLIYAVVRTFVSRNFHRNLCDLGYIDTGIFPNVRKVRDYETHGFKVCPAPHAFANRRTVPRLFNQVQTLYRLVSSKLGLDMATNVRHLELPQPEDTIIALQEVPASDFPNGIEVERERLRQAGQLRFGFYPLHEPNVMLANADRTVKAFLYFQKVDGHCSLLGLETGGHDMVVLLESLAVACERLEVKYLEVLASAYDAMLQAQLWQAYFIPCAWFPAARLVDDKQREDYLVASRTFVPLHFKGLKLTDESKPYLLEYFKLYTARLWEELVDA